MQSVGGFAFIFLRKNIWGSSFARDGCQSMNWRLGILFFSNNFVIANDITLLRKLTHDHWMRDLVYPCCRPQKKYESQHWTEERDGEAFGELETLFLRQKDIIGFFNLSNDTKMSLLHDNFGLLAYINKILLNISYIYYSNIVRVSEIRSVL